MERRDGRRGRGEKEDKGEVERKKRTVKVGNVMRKESDGGGEESKVEERKIRCKEVKRELKVDGE